MAESLDGNQRLAGIYLENLERYLNNLSKLFHEMLSSLSPEAYLQLTDQQGKGFIKSNPFIDEFYRHSRKLIREGDSIEDVEKRLRELRLVVFELNSKLGQTVDHRVNSIRWAEINAQMNVQIDLLISRAANKRLNNGSYLDEVNEKFSQVQENWRYTSPSSSRSTARVSAALGNTTPPQTEAPVPPFYFKQPIIDYNVSGKPKKPFSKNRFVAFFQNIGFSFSKALDALNRRLLWTDSSSSAAQREEIIGYIGDIRKKITANMATDGDIGSLNKFMQRAEGRLLKSDMALVNQSLQALREDVSPLQFDLKFQVYDEKNKKFESYISSQLQTVQRELERLESEVTQAINQGKSLKNHKEQRDKFVAIFTKLSSARPGLVTPEQAEAHEAVVKGIDDLFAAYKRQELIGVHRENYVESRKPAVERPGGHRERHIIGAARAPKPGRGS